MPSPMNRRNLTLYGPWNYSKVTEPFPYDDTPSYTLAGEWVSDRGKVQDWGCGTGWMRQHVRGDYVGVDGAWSPFCDVQADLRTYRSETPCIVMRHVLEHNAEWREIAANLSDSWHDRAALILFIPPQVEEMDVGEGWDGGSWAVPDLAISGPDLIEIMGWHGTRFDYVDITYPADHSMQWGWEGVLLMSR